VLKAALWAMLDDDRDLVVVTFRIHTEQR
jgi:hypothetical protein